MDEATSQSSETQEAADRAEIDSLLGGGEPEKPAAEEVQTEESADAGETGETELDGTEAEVSDDEPADEADESAETEEEESDELSIADTDRDYSQAAYERAAKVFSKNLATPFDPNDPKDRRALKEIMDRGEALKAAKAAAESTETEEETVDEKQPEQVDPRAAKTPEDIRANIETVQQFAKSKVVPQVALHVANRFVKSLWPNEKTPMNQEQANEFTAAVMEMMVFGLQEMMPSISGQTLAQLGADPVYNRVTGMAVREAALESLDTQRDASGNLKFPDLERMVDRGDIQRAIKANDWIMKVDFNERDPIKREAKRIEAAYKLARGEQVSPATVGKAVQTGKKQAEAAAKARGAARTAPGKSKGELDSGPSAGDKFVNELVSSREGAFDRAASGKS